MMFNYILYQHILLILAAARCSLDNKGYFSEGEQLLIEDLDPIHNLEQGKLK